MSSLPALWWLPAGNAPEISPEELKRWHEEGRPLQLIDSRTALEYQQGTIGEARFAPLTGMPASVDNLNLDPHIPVVALCLTGHRSLPAVRWLRSKGFEAYSLKGGITAWKKAGFSLNGHAE